MKSVLYYLSGTGNSLAVAKGIAVGIGDCTLIPIASFRDAVSPIDPGAETVGIVCPVYFYGIPVIVAEFAGRLDLSQVGYLFAVITLGGIGASPALYLLDRILSGKAGKPLDASFKVLMPGNYLPLYQAPEGEKREKILAGAEPGIARIVGAVTRRERHPQGVSLIPPLFLKLAYSTFSTTVRERDRDFTVDTTCTSCGTCARVCPVRNIQISDGKPKWLHHCERCLACLYFCPVSAIQWGPRTQDRPRHLHPDLTVSDMIAQQGEKSLSKGPVPLKQETEGKS